MKKFVFLILGVLLVACKNETIPVVSVSLLPATFVGQQEAPLFDTIPCQYTPVFKPDTMLIIVPGRRDSMRIDTIYTRDTVVIDLYRLDTFYMDTIRLNACVSYQGDKPFGPALQEVGFCMNEEVFLPVRLSPDLQTPKNVYDTIRFDILVRNTAAFMLHAYAVNPTGEIRSSSSYIRVSDLEPVKQTSSSEESE